MTQLHPDDEKQLFHVRRHLIGWRVISGQTQEQVSLKAGTGKGGLHDLETGHGVHRLSRLQRWAGAFDLRLNLDVRCVDDYEDPAVLELACEDLEVQAMFDMAFREFEAPVWQRMHLVALLQSIRKTRGFTCEGLGQRLGITAGAVSLREQHKGEPFIQNLLQYARALDVRITLQLFERDEWEAYVNA